MPSRSVTPPTHVIGRPASTLRRPALAADARSAFAMVLARRTRASRAMPGQATAGAGVEPAPRVGGAGAAIAAAARSQLGGAYVWGGNEPGGFDCSGLTRWAVRQATGQTIPRVAADQARAGQPVARDALRPGDLVFFQNTNQPGISHCGVYLGEGRFVHAATERLGTIISRLDEPYWATRYATARRVGA